MICKTERGRRCVPIKITKKTTRTPLYILGFVLLFASTVLVLAAISTNNWQITVSTFRGSVYYTSGLWYSCKNVYISWYNARTDLFCSSILSIAASWLIACETLYTIATIITVFAFAVSILGFCVDIGSFTAAIPSMIQWCMVVSTILQITTVSVYGSYGIGNYSLYQPDYSLILASVACGLSGFATLFFILESEFSSKMGVEKGYIASK